MGKKEAKEKKDKPLDKMTAKELREMALGLEGIAGVHAMNKAELITAIKEIKGIIDDKQSKSAIDKRAVKVKIQKLKEKQLAAKEAKNTKIADSLRRSISNLKKKTRRKQ
ncbi:MAG: transcription termination factor Rho [Syntrophobacteraceae bacterium]